MSSMPSPFPYGASPQLSLATDPDCRRVLLVAGEASGDLLGAHLAQALLRQDSRLQLYGLGGERMAAAGCRLLAPASALSVMGLVEVVRHLPRILAVFRLLAGALRGPLRPDLVILIDSPDFNLPLATRARRAGVPVLYYVSPQVWAWRAGRVRRIARDVAKLAAILPFEPACYEGLPLDVRYVGHPLLDEVDRAGAEPPLAAAAWPERTTPAWPLIGLFPGSRPTELAFSVPLLLETARRLRQIYPTAAFIVPLAPGLAAAPLRQAITAAGLPIRLTDASVYAVARSCTLVLAVSGTVTLQVALMETPLILFYRTAPLSYALGRLLVRIRHFGLPNIIAGRRLVPELLQHEASPERLVAEARRLLDQPALARQLRDELRGLRQQMGTPGCAERVAAMAFELLGQRP